MPSAVETTIPRGYRSCFYGHVQLAAGQYLSLNIYEPSPAFSQSARSRVHCDFFLMQTKPHSKPGLQCIRSVRLTWTWAACPTLVSVSQLWLCPSTPERPVFLITLERLDPAPQGGLYGTSVGTAVILPNDLKSAPIVQNGDDFSNNADHHDIVIPKDDTQHHYLLIYDRLDNKGIMEVVSEICHFGEGAADVVDSTVIYRWNGQKFAAPSDKR